MVAKTVQFCYSFYELHWVNLSHQINSSELSTSATTLHKLKNLSRKLLRGTIWISLLWMETLKMLWKHWKKLNPQSRRFCWAQGHMTPFSDALRTFSPTDPDWPHYGEWIQFWIGIMPMFGHLSGNVMSLTVASMTRAIHHWVAVTTLTLILHWNMKMAATGISLHTCLLRRWEFCEGWERLTSTR